MRKGWLIAAVLAGAAGVSQAADVQLFGVHTPSKGQWAVYAIISNTDSSEVGGASVSGISSIAVDVLNNSNATGSATVTGSTVQLPSGTTKYNDPTLFEPPAVGYGFWINRKNGDVAANGRTGIFAGQNIFFDSTTTGAPYAKFVIPNAGVAPGAVNTDADITSATAYDYPIKVAQGTYTPSATTGAGSQVGLKIQVAGNPGSPGVNLLRGTPAQWDAEPAASVVTIDSRNFTLKTNNSSDGSTIRATPGDANLDGVVDFNDLVKLAQSYNTKGKSWFNGDFTYDPEGTVDFNDLVQLAQNYNTTAPAGVPGASVSFEADVARAFASVPEPASLGLIGVAVVALSRKRRSK